MPAAASAARPPSSTCAPESSGSSTRPALRRTSGTTASTYSASTALDEPRCPTCTPTRADLIGELSTRSEEFRTWWASHSVRLHRTSTKQMQHPVAGALELGRRSSPRSLRRGHLRRVALTSSK